MAIPPLNKPGPISGRALEPQLAAYLETESDIKSADLQRARAAAEAADKSRRCEAVVTCTYGHRRDRREIW